jgi:hypothetical protein
MEQNENLMPTHHSLNDTASPFKLPLWAESKIISAANIATICWFKNLEKIIKEKHQKKTHITHYAQDN